MQGRLERPIRVVMFGGGPRLTHDARRFLCRLEDHPEIELAGAFCQGESRTVGAILADLWRRRGLLAIPLFIDWVLQEAWRYVRFPGRELAMRQTLRRISDRLHFVRDIHAAAVLEQVRALDPDLGLIYGSPIIKPDLFEIPGLGTFGIHHGKVPAYRGNKTTFWAMYNGEPAAGVTIQKINAGLDTGRIVLEGEVPIGSRSYGVVWRDLESLGLDLYIQAILRAKEGTAVYRPQAGLKGKLYRNPGPGEMLRFWSRQLKKRLLRSQG